MKIHIQWLNVNNERALNAIEQFKSRKKEDKKKRLVIDWNALHIA